MSSNVRFRKTFSKCLSSYAVFIKRDAIRSAWTCLDHPRIASALSCDHDGTLLFCMSEPSIVLLMMRCTACYTIKSCRRLLSYPVRSYEVAA
jgi:hypothetical protein